MAFDPGLAQSGASASRQPYPDGNAGIKLSLEEMSRRIREGRLDPRVKGWATKALMDAGIDGRSRTTVRSQVSALLEALRAQAIYVSDPVAAEYISSAAATLCLAPGLCLHGGDCFPAGTLLLRDDYEFVPIEKIKVGDRIWGLDQWTTVGRVVFKGELAVDAIDMNNGSTMFLTGDHKVYVGRCKHDRGVCPSCYPALCQERFERVHVSDLAEGEVLLQPERIEFGSGNPDPDRMYVEGLALADGWVHHNGYRFHIAGRDGMRKEAQKHEVKTICNRLGIETLWHRRYITVKDEAWSQRIAGLGERARFKHLETINLTEASAEAALRGLMADSTPSAGNRPDGERTYSTTSRQLMLQVRVLHRMFGKSTGYKFLTPEQHGGAGRHPLWRLGVRKPGSKTLTVRSIERAVRKVPCWDISTEDHYVYLPEHDVTVSNCDDLTVALASAIMSIGIPAVIVKQSFGRDAQEHVLVAAQDESGNWIYADPSTRLPVGSAASASEEVWVDPLSPIGQLPEVQAELVSLGKPRKLHQVAGRWFEERHDRLWVHDTATGWHDTGLSGFPEHTGVGTNIFGYPTVSDLKDLLNAAAYFLGQLQAAAAACAGWADATAWATWQSDLTQVQSHFDDAVTLGNEIINKTPAWLMNVRVASGVDGGFAWERVREVIRDITDLDRRFRQAGGCVAPNYPDTPQPTTPDTQLEAYKTADALAKGAEQLGNKIKDPTTIAIGGVVVGIAVAIGAAIVIDRLLPRR